MDKKAHSGPMTETLDRLRAFRANGWNEFKVIFFGEGTILNEPVEDWPLCDALIAFFSTGFPLDKAREYAALRKPFVFNDLDRSHLLLDRREIYRLLEDKNVPVPRHVILDANQENEVEDCDEYISINGERIPKPVVEKPVSAEDHNIHIYYPRSLGGGSKRLFRKVKDQASKFYPGVHTTRAKDGNSYIYEELLQTEGTDVKVYTIGPEYAHAEARKSPIVDGKVRRNARGKEERYPVILTPEEKDIARKVVLAFDQNVCGFDLLRSGGKSFVCDVNGWSFVKDSEKFWSDSANLLRQYMLEAILPSHLRSHPDADQAPAPEEEGEEEEGVVEEEDERDLAPASEDLPSDRPVRDRLLNDGELLCVTALVRHGDRTPKEKLKFQTRDPAFLKLLRDHRANPEDVSSELKVRSVAMLTLVKDVVKDAITTAEVERARRGGDVSEDGDGQDDMDKLRTVLHVLERRKIEGVNRKIQLKPTHWEPGPRGEPAVVTEAQFILKWGGELTPLGEAQAEHLGTVFRKALYPDEFGGVLRLHATYRHDLKIYASEEGRVQMTAAAFTKGFLDLDGYLTPIIASLVNKDAYVTRMLDETPDSGRQAMESAKLHINTVLSSDEPIAQDECGALGLASTASLSPVISAQALPAALVDVEPCPPPFASAAAPAPAQVPPLLLDLTGAGQSRSPLMASTPPTASGLRARCLRGINQPRSTLLQLHTLIVQLTDELRQRAEARDPPLPQPANGETPLLQYSRWSKLRKDFYKPKKERFDTTKIPDVYDNAMYDVLHNEHLGLHTLADVYRVAHTLAVYVVPQEYGIDKRDKVLIGYQIGCLVLNKIRRDLLAGTSSVEHEYERVHQLDSTHMTDVRSPQRHVRSRLYFTSESHIHALFNLLRWGHEVAEAADGRPLQSIFSEQARRRFDEMEVRLVPVAVAPRVAASPLPQQRDLPAGARPGVLPHAHCLPRAPQAGHAAGAQELIRRANPLQPRCQPGPPQGQQDPRRPRRGHAPHGALVAAGPDGAGGGQVLRRAAQGHGRGRLGHRQQRCVCVRARARTWRAGRRAGTLTPLAAPRRHRDGRLRQPPEQGAEAAAPALRGTDPRGRPHGHGQRKGHRLGGRALEAAGGVQRVALRRPAHVVPRGKPEPHHRRGNGQGRAAGRRPGAHSPGARRGSLRPVWSRVPWGSASLPWMAA